MAWLDGITKVCRAYRNTDLGWGYRAIAPDVAPPYPYMLAPDFIRDENGEAIACVMDDNPESPDFGYPAYWYCTFPEGAYSAAPESA
jgi:hypothetical protein